MAPRLALLALLSPLAVAACSSGEGSRKPTVSVPWGPSAEGSHRVAAARWAYTPARPAGLLGKIALDPGHDLYVGQRGERWVVDKGRTEAEAAGDLAEQDLVAVGRSAAGGLVFVGQAGGMFEAPSPLAAFSRVLSAPEPVAHVDASGQRLLAVTTRGQLLASQDGGASFARVPVDAPFVGDVALLDEGRGLLLAYPEKLFSTTDAGLHWAPVDAPSVGATRLVRLPGLVAVGGLGGSLLWRPDTPPRFSRSTPSADGFTLPVDLAPGPEVGELLGGRGVVQGDEVWVTRTPTRRGEPWRLGLAHLGQRLETEPLAETELCQRLAVARSGRWLVVACSVAPRGSRTAQIRFLRYADGKGAPELLSSSLEGPLGEVRVALGREGQLLVSGACRPGLGRGACDPDAPLLLPRWESAPSLDMVPAASATPAPPPAPSAAPSGSAAPEISSPWVAAVSPSQAGRPLAMAFAPTGSAVYLLARRGKSNELSIFVSHDGGRRFEGRDLGLASAAGDERRAAQSIALASLSVTDEGIVAAAMEGQAGALLAVTDEDGRLLSLSSPPVFSPRVRLGVAGRRALAVDGTQAFESLDGGVSWQTLGDTLALRCEGGSADCLNAVACGTGGCVVGASASRVGWGGQADGRRPLDPDARTLSFSSLQSPPPPLVCRLSKDKWIPLPRGASVPTIHSADRGKNLWTTAVEDEVHGGVSVIHGLPGGKIEEVPLLPPVARGTRVALAVSSSQIEGTAALRFTIPTANSTGAEPPVRSVELAWENLFEGKISRTTLKDPGFINRTNRGPDRSELALPGFTSISNGGLFVRPGPRPTDPIFFVDHRGKAERMSPARFPDKDVSGNDLSLRTDLVRLGTRNVAVAFQEGNVAFRGHAGSDEVDVMTLFPPPGQGFEMTTSETFSYLGSTPMLVHFATDRSGLVRAGLFPFRADGPVLGPRTPAPTQAGLAARFRGCSAQDRATTARVIAPPEPGSRRGVLIEGPDGSRFAALVSAALVLYGTVDSPCGGALDAVMVEDVNRGDESDRVLVSLSDLERSWFFRAINDRVEVRSMTCRLSPGAPLPPAVLRAVESDDSPRRRGGNQNPLIFAGAWSAPALRPPPP